MEPDFVAQNGDALTREEHDAWVKRCVETATAEGCTHARWTKHDQIPHLFLVEAWKVRPDDEGEPRFALTTANAS
jgi:hypothetical protein